MPSQSEPLRNAALYGFTANRKRTKQRQLNYQTTDYEITKSNMPDVTLTVDGKKFTTPAGTLLIEACKSAGIEVPSFCYYPNLSLQGACRMCLVKIEKMPKLQTACTTVVTEGMIVTTENEEVRQARKSMVEMLLGNHPLDCPVCDAGGECELQDMTFNYGAAESSSWRPRTTAKSSSGRRSSSSTARAASSATAACASAAKAWTSGPSASRTAAPARSSPPIKNDHLECEECGMCIDVCPVGALTSGAYRYKTRPWEMNHVGTICTHCGDGCKTTLGVRRSDTGMRDRPRRQSRQERHQWRFPVHQGPLRLRLRRTIPSASRQPLIRNGRQARARHLGRGVRADRGKSSRNSRQDGGRAIGVIGSNRTTNEENYLLQKFARLVLRHEQHRPSPHRRLPCLRLGAGRQAECDRVDARRLQRARDSADRQ